MSGIIQRRILQLCVRFSLVTLLFLNLGDWCQARLGLTFGQHIANLFGRPGTRFAGELHHRLVADSEQITRVHGERPRTQIGAG